mmetsp:Transcript_53982/g.152116  ORF Transcript_53982/g.152116 Transcript_53982/m.152116 type:complete len:210 (-) Transcript_53982:287-916(-)
MPRSSSVAPTRACPRPAGARPPSSEEPVGAVPHLHVDPGPARHRPLRRRLAHADVPRAGRLARVVPGARRLLACLQLQHPRGGAELDARCGLRGRVGILLDVAHASECAVSARAWIQGPRVHVGLPSGSHRVRRACQDPRRARVAGVVLAGAGQPAPALVLRLGPGFGARPEAAGDPQVPLRGAEAVLGRPLEGLAVLLCLVRRRRAVL